MKTKYVVLNLSKYMTTDKALRYNEWKAQWSLVDFDSLEPMVRVLEFWSKKYAIDNWKKPMDKKKILDSLMRHLVRINAWEEIDPESWLPHIWHLMCNALFYSFHARNSTEHPDTS